MSETIEYGPLAGLIGTWFGDQGLDLSPEPDGKEENPYCETIVFEGAGDVTNAEEQRLVIVRYHQVVSRRSNDEVFHDQVGYWTWDPERRVVAHSIAIPRALTVLAGGTHSGEAEEDGSVRLYVKARLGDPEWGILQSPFLREKARTLTFEMELTVGPSGLAYRETTGLEIYGRSFDHTDENRLERRA